MLSCWYETFGSVLLLILLLTPNANLAVHVGYVVETPSWDEVVLHIANESLNRSFRPWMLNLCKLCAKSNCLLEQIIVVVPDWVAITIAFYYDTLHVVCVYELGGSPLP